MILSMTEVKPKTGIQTSSTHHPSTAALMYSSSVSGRRFKISTVSTTDKPRFNLPPGTL